ncbi:uncharacterized protein LODBEIA_P18310 [Lodderomyces beijingensis]|uniref:VPS37 C-terminal domain-containing protein n=1 Tax=Lodderomyces beijingensis TaxID=1775926 RepID=A0ABP0ZN39_9ASCO
MSDQSQYRPTIHQFLLRTENLQPLVTAVSQLLSETSANQTRLDQICHGIDTNFRFPHQVSVTEPAPSPSPSSASASPQHTPHTQPPQSDDSLTYLIEQKYGYRRNAEMATSRDSAMDSLSHQISFLKKLKDEKMAINRELYAITQEYETAVFTEILPELRRKLQSEMSSDFVRELLELKFAKDADVYRAYVKSKSQS